MSELLLVGAKGERHHLDKPRLTVGREPQCDIVLDDPSVSREHAVLELRDGTLTVTDNGARNGTFVDGVRLPPKSSACAYSTVGFGHCVLSLEAAPTEKDVHFEVADLLPSPQKDALADLMYRAQAALSPAQPIDMLEDALLHLCLAFVPGDFAAVQVQEVRGLLRSGKTVHREVALSTGLRNKVLREKKTVLIRDLHSDNEMKHRPSLINAGVQSAIAAPIFDGDEVMGLLYVTSNTAALNEVDATTCTVLASVAGTSLLAARMMRDLLEQNEALRKKVKALGGELED